MTIEEIMSEESGYLEFNRMVSEKSEIYMKTVVAFANGSGGRIVFCVENGTLNVVGIKQENVLSLMDGITLAICDSCTLMITPL